MDTAEITLAGNLADAACSTTGPCGLTSDKLSYPRGGDIASSSRRRYPHTYLST